MEDSQGIGRGLDFILSAGKRNFRLRRGVMGSDFNFINVIMTVAMEDELWW